MIFTSAILSWGLCALWGVFHSQSTVDPILAALSRLRTLSLSSVTAFLHISASNTERLRTLDIVAPLEGADSFNIQLPLGDGFKHLRTDPNPASNFTPGPNTFFAPGVQDSLHHPFLLRIVLSCFTGIVCFLAVFAVYSVILYGRTGSSSNVKFILSVKEGISSARKHMPALLPSLEPTMILDSHLDTSLATILDDTKVDCNGSRLATPEDIPYDPLAFVFHRSPTSTREMNILRSPVPAFVPSSDASSPEGWRLDGGWTAGHPERSETTDLLLPRPHLHDPFFDPTPQPLPLPPFIIMSTSLSSPLLEDEFPTIHHSGESHTQTESDGGDDGNDDEEIGEYIRFTPNIQPIDDSIDDWWPDYSSHPAWRLARLGVDNPYLYHSLSSLTTTSASSLATPSDFFYTWTSAPPSPALSSSASYDYFASDIPAPCVDSNEDDARFFVRIYGEELEENLRAVLGIQLGGYVLMQIYEDYFYEYPGLFAELGIQRGFSDLSAWGWSYLEGFDGFEDLDLIIVPFPDAPISEELDDPFLYTTVPVDAG